MNLSFQTFVVGVIVIAAHVGALLALKPFSQEATRYFGSLETDRFVEEVLVKGGSETAPPEVSPEGSLAPQEESIAEVVPERSANPTGAAPVAEAEELPAEIDISEERDSVRAVTDVRAFAGRIDEPALIDQSDSEPETKTIIAAEKPREEPPQTDETGKPKTVGPLEVRAIPSRPRS